MLPSPMLAVEPMLAVLKAHLQRADPARQGGRGYPHSACNRRRHRIGVAQEPQRPATKPSWRSPMRCVPRPSSRPRRRRRCCIDDPTASCSCWPSSSYSPGCSSRGTGVPPTFLSIDAEQVADPTPTFRSIPRAADHCIGTAGQRAAPGAAATCSDPAESTHVSAAAGHLDPAAAARQVLAHRKSGTSSAAPTNTPASNASPSS